MKFHVSRDALIRPLQLVTGVVERRQTIPILSNVMLTLEGNELSITGTDSEVELIGRVPLGDDQVGVTGSLTVPARKFTDICRQLPEDADIDIELADQRLVIRSGRFRSTLAILPSDQYPSVDQSDVSQEIEIAANKLKKLIDRTSFAMAQQDVRHFLNGMLLEIKGSEIISVATDGHRLAKCNFGVGADTEASSVIIPRKGVLEIQKLLDDTETPAKVAFGASHVRVETDNYCLTSKLVDGRFPDYERVIPRNGDKVVTLDREEMRDALARTAILTNEKFRGIRVSLSQGEIQFSANNPEQEEAEEHVAVDYSGSDLEVGFNVGYLIDVLSVMASEKVRMVLLDADNSALLEEPEVDDSVYVVMPMKL